jgi:hypothetical protein
VPSIPIGSLYHIHLYVRGLKHLLVPGPKEPIAAMKAYRISNNAYDMKGIIGAQLMVLDVITKMLIGVHR